MRFTCRAMTRFSWAGTAKTAVLESDALIRRTPSPFASLSEELIETSLPDSTSARVSASCFPIPPVNTIAPNPDISQAKPPIVFGMPRVNTFNATVACALPSHAKANPAALGNNQILQDNRGSDHFCGFQSKVHSGAIME